MAKYLYDKGRQKFLEGRIDWLRDTIKVALVDTDSYAVNQSTDEFYSILSAYVVGTPVALNPATKTTVAGVADAADVTFTAVAAGPQLEAVVFYKECPTANGTGDSVDNPDGSLLQTVTDAAGLFTSQMERGYIKITGMSNSANNGSFYIVKYTSATEIDIYNPNVGAAAETSAFTWSIESPLIAYIDEGTGLPVTPNGGDLTLVFSEGASKIFKL